MGISIHYWGSIGNQDQLEDLVEELLEFARVLKWRADEIEPDESGELPWVRGVIVNFQNGSESVPFLLDSNGGLRSMVYLMGHTDEFTKTVSVKTQYGTVDDHKSLVNLLRYLKKQYFPDLEVSDEGGLWEGGSEEAFIEKKEFLNAALDMLVDEFSKSGLSKEDFEGGEVSEGVMSIFEKVHRMMKEKREGDAQEGKEEGSENQD